MCNPSAISLESFSFEALTPSPRIRNGKRTLLDLDAIRALGPDCSYNATTLAARLGISIRQLQRLFARQLGCSPRAWLREERMQAAHRLLLRASTIKEVALALSFRQESHFSRDFRSRFGYTPSTLQKSGAAHGLRPALGVRGAPAEADPRGICTQACS
jgi:AraC-like DNA-binding protein